MEAQVREIIAKQMGVNVSTVTDGAVLESDLMVDSLDTVEIMMAFEEEFGVEIPDDDAESWKNVRDIIFYLKGKTA